VLLYWWLFESPLAYSLRPWFLRAWQEFRWPFSDPIEKFSQSRMRSEGCNRVILVG